MSQEQLEDVKCTIRGVLTSSGVALGLYELIKDYKNLDGSDIPFRLFGHSNVLAFLRSIPDTVQLTNPESNSTMVYAVADSKTSHITSMISHQKSNPKATKFRRPYRGPPRGPFQGSHHSRFNNIPFRPTPRIQQEEFITPDFRRDALRLLEDKPEGLPLHEFEHRVNNVARNHAMNVSYLKIEGDLRNFIDVEDGRVYLRENNGSARHQPSRAYRDNYEFSASGSEEDFDNYDQDDYEHDDRSTSHTEPTLTNGNNAQPNSDSIDHDIPPRIVKNIQSLIQAEENRGGIWLHDFLNKYLNKFNQELDLGVCGCDEVLELVGKLDNIIHRQRYQNEGDHLLKDARFVKEVVCEETGSIPSYVINNMKKLLTKRDHKSLISTDLPTEYKKYTGSTLDPWEFGFGSMDSFFKSLEESCSDFCFMPVKDRIYIRLNSTPNEVKSSRNTNEPILPNGPSFSPFPAEVCNTDSRLPSNPLFESLKRDDVFPVTIAEVYNPWRFFIHHEEDIETLERMMDDLNVFYVENEKEYEVLPMTVSKGLLCACTYSADNRWHRVSIVNMKLRTAKVKFVDYGTQEDVEVKRLRYLHNNFAKHPAMCSRAKLTCVQSKSTDIEHLTRLNNYFYKIVMTGTLEATFISYDAKQDSYEISLKCSPNKEPPFIVADCLLEEGFVDIRVDQFVELTKDTPSSPFFTPESLRPAEPTNRPSPSRAENGETSQKPTSSSASPVAPVSQPSPQPPSPQKGPPPGLSLPSGAQSQNYNNLFSSPLNLKSSKPSSVKGSKKKSVPYKNAGLCGSPLIAQPTLNPPFVAAPMNVPPAYMGGLSCATSFDPLFMPSVPPFAMPPSVPPYATPGFPQYSPYCYSYPAPPAAATPNPYAQFFQRPHPPHVRPPPGFGPLNFPPRPAYAPPYGQAGFAATPPAGRNGSVGNGPTSYQYEPLVTLAQTTSTTTTKSTIADKFEWPITDPELASQWEKKRSEPAKTEDKGGSINGKANEAMLDTQPTENPLVAGIDAVNLDAQSNSFEDLIAIEKARERRGAESTLKKCFDFSHSLEVMENVRTYLETQTQPLSEDASAAKSSQPATTLSPEADSWEPKPRSRDEVTLKLNAMLAKIAEDARGSKARTPSPVMSTKEANLADSPGPKTSTPTPSVSANGGASPKESKKPCKLESIKQMVMQRRK